MVEITSIDVVYGCSDNQFFVDSLICSIHQTFKVQSKDFKNLKIHILDEQISPQNKKIIEQQFTTDQKNFSTDWQLQFYPIDWFREFAQKNNIPQVNGTYLTYSKIAMLKSLEPISDYILYLDADNFVFHSFQDYFEGYQDQTVLGIFIWPYYRNCYNKKIFGSIGSTPRIIRYQIFMNQYYEEYMEKYQSKLLYGTAFDEFVPAAIVGTDFYDWTVVFSIYPKIIFVSAENAPWNKKHYDSLEFEKINQIYQETIIAKRSDLLVEKDVKPIPTYWDVNVKLGSQIFAWIEFWIRKTYYLQKLIRTIIPTKYL